MAKYILSHLAYYLKPRNTIYRYLNQCNQRGITLFLAIMTTINIHGLHKTDK
jgi:hypothetical protein